jgi:hypothetical protein
MTVGAPDADATVDPMDAPRDGAMTSGRLLTEVSNAMVEDALLPAERARVEMGQQQRVRESRLFMKTATANRFIAEVERIVGRNVASFSSASDPDRGLVLEFCIFEPLADGGGSAA